MDVGVGQVVVDALARLDPGAPGLFHGVDESGAGARIALRSARDQGAVTAEKFVGLLSEVVGEGLQEGGAGAELQLGELFGLVAGVFGVHQFREEELLEFGPFAEDGRRGQRRPEEGHVVPRRHAHFVPKTIFFFEYSKHGSSYSWLRTVKFVWPTFRAKKLVDLDIEKNY